MPIEATIPGVDAIGVDGRARVVARLVAPFQEARYELELIQMTNQLEDDNPIPGYPEGPDGPVSFQARNDELLQLEQDVYASVAPRVMDRLREIIGTED